VPLVTNLQLTSLGNVVRFGSTATIFSPILNERPRSAACATPCSNMIRPSPVFCIALLLSTCAHLVLLFALHSPPLGGLIQDGWGKRPAIHFLLLPPPAPRAPLPAPPVNTARQGHRLASRAAGKPGPALSMAASSPTQGASATAAAVPEPEKAPEIDELAQIPATPSPISAAEIMRAAKRDIGKISRELSKELPARDKAFSSESQNRLDRRFAEAHAAVRPEWFRAAKIEEITTATSGGARVYRITTAVGTFCVTYRSSGGRPVYGTCP
jgi:hypothetical protein